MDRRPTADWADWADPDGFSFGKSGLIRSISPTVLATFVFCSVPDPVQGLREALRVTRPGGRLLLLEHMLARSEPLARIMTQLDPSFHWLSGVHIARRTVDTVAAAGWRIDSVTSLSPGSIFRHIVAHRAGAGAE